MTDISRFNEENILAARLVAERFFDEVFWELFVKRYDFATGWQDECRKRYTKTAEGRLEMLKVFRDLCEESQAEEEAQQKQ
jgi:hypothetical protein